MAWLTSPPGTSHVQLARAATKKWSCFAITPQQHRYVLTSCCRFDSIPLCRLVSNFTLVVSHPSSLLSFLLLRSEYLYAVLLISGHQCQLDIAVDCQADKISRASNSPRRNMNLQSSFARVHPLAKRSLLLFLVPDLKLATRKVVFLTGRLAESTRTVE